METIGRYNIIGELGRGSSGSVFKAHDRHLDRLVAIKVLTPNPTHTGKPQRTEEMFFREGRATARLMHPGIVEIFDVFDVFEGAEAGRPCMVMEFVPGGTLASRLQPETPLPLHQALDFAAQIAEVLEYAHSHCFIHRDLKPANILMGENDRIKITDLGLAEFAGRVGSLVTESIDGTPSYMAPCRIKGEKYDARSDLFSLGVIFYQMLTGRLPFAGETSAVLYGIVNENPVAPSQLNPDLPAKYDALIERCLAKKPSQRIASAREFSDELKKLTQPSTLALAESPAVSSSSPAILAIDPADPAPPREKQVSLSPAERSSNSTAGQAIKRSESPWRIAGIDIRPLQALQFAALLFISSSVVGGKVLIDSMLAGRHTLPSTVESAVSASLNFSPPSGLGTNPANQAFNPGPDHEKNQPIPKVTERSSSSFNPWGSKLPGLSFAGSKLSSSNAGATVDSAAGAHEIIHRNADLRAFQNPNNGVPSARRTALATDQNMGEPKLVHFVCDHDLREAVLTVSLDGKVLIKDKLRGRRRSFLGMRGTYEGVVSRVITLPARTTLISIDVTNSDGSEDLNDVATADSLESGHRTLRASVKAGKLSLAWEPSSHSVDASAGASFDSGLRTAHAIGSK